MKKVLFALVAIILGGSILVPAGASANLVNPTKCSLGETSALSSTRHEAPVYAGPFVQPDITTKVKCTFYVDYVGSSISASVIHSSNTPVVVVGGVNLAPGPEAAVYALPQGTFSWSTSLIGRDLFICTETYGTGVLNTYTNHGCYYHGPLD